MNRCFFLAALLAVNQACAAEAWRPVFEDERFAVFVDVASFARQGSNVRFRERELMRVAYMDAGSLRKIVEVQYRRQANCASRRLAVLSRAFFSQNSALVGYEAIRPEQAIWLEPVTQRDAAVLLTVCGQV